MVKKPDDRLGTGSEEMVVLDGQGKQQHAEDEDVDQAQATLDDVATDPDTATV